MKRIEPAKDAIDWDAKATEALEAARSMRPGQEKTDALKKAGMLRNAADLRGLFFAKRGRPSKHRAAGARSWRVIGPHEYRGLAGA